MSRGRGFRNVPIVAAAAVVVVIGVALYVWLRPSQEERKTVYWAIREGDVEKLRSMIDSNPRQANALYDDRTPLTSLTGIYSPVPNRNEMMRVVLERGADPNADAYRYFSGCIYSSDVECMQVLLEFGADPTRKNAEGKTAIDYARSDGAGGMAEVLERAVR